MRFSAHFFNTKKQTNYMLYAATIFALILIFPLYVSLFIAYDARYKKLYFGVYIFGAFKVLSGYFKPRDRKCGYLHLKNKAYYLKYSSVFKMDKSPVTLTAFTVTEVYSSAFLRQGEFSAVYGLSAFYYALQTASLIACGKFPYLKLKNNLYISSDGFTTFAFNAKISFCFNVFAIIINATENIIKKGVKSAKKRKQNCRSN